MALSDLALTLLGELFRSEPDKPFFPIFDYFQRHGLADYAAATESTLYQHFRILIGGYLKKRLFHLRKSEQRQAEILKRRVKDILQPPDYVRLDDQSSLRKSIAKRKYMKDLRPDREPISREVLAETVRRAYVESSNRVNWCDRIFSEINDMKSVQNFLNINHLLESIVKVNGEALEEMCPQPASPDLRGIRGAVEEAVRNTVDWARENVLTAFVASGKISPVEANMYLRAVEQYLLDLGNCGETDKLPVYFREAMPDSEQGEYRERHKYPFRTVISKSADYFRSRLAEGMT